MTPTDALKALVVAAGSIQINDRALSRAVKEARKVLKVEWVEIEKNEVETWHRLDLGYRFKHRQDRLRIARELGYLYISQAIICEYRKLKSTILVGELLGLTSPSVLVFLRWAGEPMAHQGGSNHYPGKLSARIVNRALVALTEDEPGNLNAWCRQYTMKQGLRCSYRQLAQSLNQSIARQTAA